MNFIHASDFHLGYAQYGLIERFKDYARSFRSVIQYAIEGNHDLAFHQDGKSWLEILNSQGLLRLIRLKEANGVKLMGDYVELESVRIFGVRYLGSSTLSVIPQIAEEIKKISAANGEKYNILMMHFGMTGQMRQEAPDEIHYNSLLPLKEAVNYLALGHYHMQYDLDGWIFNPGSVEMTAMNEYGLPKGFYHIRDSGGGDKGEICKHPWYKEFFKLIYSSLSVS